MGPLFSGGFAGFAQYETRCQLSYLGDVGKKKLVPVLAHDDFKPKEILYSYIIILSVGGGVVQL